jgi:Zn-dependent protease
MHSVVQIWISPMLKGLLFGLFAMALHEGGHLCTAWAVGVRVKRVGLCWKGMYTVREPGPPVKNIQISLAGPLTNLALMVFWPVWPVFGLANLICGACNLLPIQGSDGNRVLDILGEMREAKLASPDRQESAKRKGSAPAEVGLNRPKATVDPAA